MSRCQRKTRQVQPLSLLPEVLQVFASNFANVNEASAAAVAAVRKYFRRCKCRLSYTRRMFMRLAPAGSTPFEAAEGQFEVDVVRDADVSAVRRRRRRRHRRYRRRPKRMLANDGDTCHLEKIFEF
jgi:hypothetical protein